MFSLLLAAVIALPVPGYHVDHCNACYGSKLCPNSGRWPHSCCKRDGRGVFIRRFRTEAEIRWRLSYD